MSELAKGDFIAVDTEFHRESTYWPQVCLIQLATDDYDCMVDPLAKGIDLKPLLDLIWPTPSRVKVFHAARQDLEIFTRLMGQTPAPVFDTQIAAMAAGLGDSISYENLVSRVVKGTVDKSSQFTDWARRPLSDKQLQYARSDVTTSAHLSDPPRQAAEAGPHRLDRGRARSSCRSGQLLVRSCGCLEAPEDPQVPQRLSRRPRQRLGMARARGAGKRQAARPYPQGRRHPGDRPAETSHASRRWTACAACNRALPNRATAPA